MLDFIFPRVCPFCESISKDWRVCNSCLSRIRFVGGGSICLKCGVPFDFADIPDPDANPFKSAASSVALNNISEEQEDADALNICRWRPCTHHRRASDNERPDGVAPTTIHGHLCGECLLGGFNFERARSVAFYDGLLRDILHKFKYEGKLKFGGALSSIMIENFPDDLDAPDVIIPVPLYIGRLRQREYNQSVVLGENLSKYLRVSFTPFVLKRLRDTKPQFEIKSEEEKRRNVRGAFSIENSEEIKQKSVLLIDDVFTTGSTIDECSMALLDSGASRVQVVTLMRAVQI